MSQIDCKKNMKDAMWALFLTRENSGNDCTYFDKMTLKENVARLVLMTTQKNGELYESKDCVDWNSLEPTMFAIVCAATHLAMHGAFGKMPETIEN